MEHILAEKWALQPEDKDMIVMYHKFGYHLSGRNRQIESSMVVKGDDRTNTAMAKTVGLPVAIATRLILNQQIVTPGVLLPISCRSGRPEPAQGHIGDLGRVTKGKTQRNTYFVCDLR